MDLELLRRFEVEIGSTRARQRGRELQFRDVLALDTSTTVDELAKVATAPILCRPPHLEGVNGSPCLFRSGDSQDLGQR